MAVLRGKVSEGLDFNDQNARAVIVCGIPFPPLLDPRVVLKKKYLDTNRNRENELQSGQEWYVLEAVRAVNQAIGRVIRHKDDYGAILLCDRRFHSNKNQLSRWIQAPLKNQNANEVNFGQTVGELARFFRNACATLPAPQVREVKEKITIKYEKDEDFLKVDSKEIVKQQIKIENSNEIYATTNSSSSDKVKLSSDELTKYAEEMKQKFKARNQGFLNFLERDISGINFNAATSTSTSSASSHNNNNIKIENPLKSQRTEDSQDSQENSSKRRKLRVIPNSNQIIHPDVKVEPLENLRVEVHRSDYEKIIPKDKKLFLEGVS
jgi:regulator of telomere elongation helicase 1